MRITQFVTILGPYAVQSNFGQLCCGRLTSGCFRGNNRCSSPILQWLVVWKKCVYDNWVISYDVRYNKMPALISINIMDIITIIISKKNH